MKAVILCEKGVQDEEYIYPYYRLQEENFDLDVATINGEITYGKYGIPVRTNKKISELSYRQYDIVIVPGGWECPEKLRMNQDVLKFIRNCNESKKIIGAICHGPQVLISSNILKGKKATCYAGMKDDLVNAGAEYLDQNVVVSDNIITSPHYRNNHEFMREILLNCKKCINYNDVIVKKPWGYEFIIHQNNDIGIWYLNINKDEKTSLHSHPSKKTGLIVLSGKAEVSFLNGTHILNPGEKIMIRSGVFHSTKALESNLELIEIETPNDKNDLLRLEDNYGRTGCPYESCDNFIIKKDYWDLYEGKVIGKCLVKIETIKERNDFEKVTEGNVVFISGKIVSRHFSVLTPGDVIDVNNLKKVLYKFDPVFPIELGVIKLC